MLQQLSAQDASFLYQDSPSTPMHVGSIAILDPSTSPYGPLNLNSVLSFYEERLHLMPTARRKLVHVPFNADHPYWIEDESFDLEYHLREVALPMPQDWRQLYILCARLFARPLDMTRPPWESYLVHGLNHLDGVPTGSVGLLTKTHHCAIDGQSGMEMAMAVADLAPEMAPVQPPKERWRPDPVPTDAELIMRSVGHSFLRPTQMAELAARNFDLPMRLSALPRQELPRQTPIPKTRFNAEVSPHRVVGMERFSLDEVRAIKNAVPKATVNDVALSLCGGALRRYLAAKHELPTEQMVAMAPISVRKESKSYTQGNQVSAMFVGIGTHIADPKARLEAVRDNTHTAKQFNDAVGAATMLEYNQFVPAAVSNMAQRLTAEFARANTTAPAFNCSITNVPGPMVPIYTMGCRTITTLGYGPITHNMGLIVPISSYCGEFSVSFTSCRGMVPDPEFFLACIRESFDELSAATLGSDPADRQARIDAVAKNYDHLATQALEQVKQARAKAEAAS